MSAFDDFDVNDGEHRYMVRGLTRDTGWVERRQYIPRSWTFISGFPVTYARVEHAKQLREKLPSGKFRPRWDHVRTDFYVVRVRPDLLVTGVILGGQKPKVGFKMWNDRRILKKHLIGFIWVSEEDQYKKSRSLELQAEAAAEWASRCPFWPWDE